MTITETNLPKAAAALVADAKAAGMDVKVGAWGSGVDVSVERGSTSVTVTWTTQMYGGARGGGCNFYTSSGKQGVRFSHASGYAYSRPQRVDSVKQARALLGLAI